MTGNSKNAKTSTSLAEIISKSPLPISDAVCQDDNYEYNFTERAEIIVENEITEKCEVKVSTCEVLKSKELLFTSLIDNSQSIPLPGFWIPQVIVSGVKCIMWVLWKPMYSGISKCIVLFSDMTVHVSNFLILF